MATIEEEPTTLLEYVIMALKVRVVDSAMFRAVDVCLLVA
jgi:hypothetical protein